jgi:hypothetical protein
MDEFHFIDYASRFQEHRAHKAVEIASGNQAIGLGTLRHWNPPLNTRFLTTPDYSIMLLEFHGHFKRKGVHIRSAPSLDIMAALLYP